MSGRSLFLTRWTLRCAAAEAIGMTAASAAAKLSQAAATGESPTASGRLAGLALVIAGGLVEGAALGAFQAAGLAEMVPRLDRRRWRRVTVAVAGLGWAAASAPAVLSGTGTDSGTPPLAAVLGGAAGLGLVMGGLLGAAQTSCLRGRVSHPYRWIGINALAWCPVMAIIFLGAMAPAAQWAVLPVMALGALTGLTAGAVLGLVTGVLTPTLGSQPPQVPLAQAIRSAVTRG